MLLPPLPPDDDELLALAFPEGTPEQSDGLFPADGWLRRVNSDPVAILGGARALLLEVAHPFVAVGVAEHSKFRTDPYGRLRRTLDAMSAMVFGDASAAIAAARGIEHGHQRVHGELPEAMGRFPAGTAYHGRDPGAVRWVWATLVDTSLAIYERFVAPLDAAARDEFCADYARVGRLMGLAADFVPADHASFRAYFDAVLESDELVVTPIAREIADSVLYPQPEIPMARRVRSITAGLLPPRFREAFGLRWDAEKQSKLEAWVDSIRRLRAAGSRSGAGVAPGSQI